MVNFLCFYQVKSQKIQNLSPLKKNWYEFWLNLLPLKKPILKNWILNQCRSRSEGSFWERKFEYFNILIIIDHFFSTHTPKIWIKMTFFKLPARFWEDKFPLLPLDPPLISYDLLIFIRSFSTSGNNSPLARNVEIIKSWTCPDTEDYL